MYGGLQLFLGFLGIVALIGIGTYVAMRARRWATGGDEPATSETFTLQDIREMRDRGEINEVEYQSLRAGILGAVGGKTSSRESALGERFTDSVVRDSRRDPPPSG